MALRFDGRVAIVTGAGAGIGRAYALELARRGASVVVNDLGGAIDGSGPGAGARPADIVVQEIKAAGGKAAPNYDSVVDGEKIVKTSLDSFGRIDAIITNSGILRDRSFQRMSRNDFDLVHQVHVQGSKNVIQAAWPHMQKQEYGRVVLVTSINGLYGAFGQANYSSAKSAMVGLGKTLAKEGKKKNIKVNVVAPGAGSRMTKTVLPAAIVDEWKPEYAVPQAVFLLHEDVPTSGMIFETGGGFMGAIKWQAAAGKYFNIEDDKPKFTVEDIKQNWADVVRFDDKARDPEDPKEGGPSNSPQIRSVLAKIRKQAKAKAKAKL
jgi:3-hydroxyacyl-CoA dehydrogenase/3a,7a,12a-trihydroxy-5b-cholest-24-enoyl-CoA hydratase